MGIVKGSCAEVQDGNLHLFTLKANGPNNRSWSQEAQRLWNGSGCLPDLRGRRLSPRDGQNVSAGTAHRAIYIPSIGAEGRMHPLVFTSQVTADEVVIDVSR